MPEPAFDCRNLLPPASPVVVSVPHAGRDYPLPLRAMLRVPVAALRPLEDRYMDRVAEAAVPEGPLIVQRRARAWIDLNRGEDERDPLVDDGARRRGGPPASAKLRSGLGLVPRRVAGAGELWRRRLSDEEVRARLDDAHRPYHAALGAALAAARARFGVAVLLDLHSMPPLGAGEPEIVVGDRFGRACGDRFVRTVEGAARDVGLRVGLNAPYAGGQILDRHGRPGAGIHALQLEIDRRLYLDPPLAETGRGFDQVVALVAATVARLEDEALGQALLAAE